MRDMGREDRRTQRIRSKGSTEINDHGQRVWGRIIDLSTGGILMTSDRVWEPGERAELAIAFDALPGTRFALTGVVRRSLSGGIAIELDSMPRELQAYVIEELVAAVAHDAVPNVIIVDAKSAGRTAIAAAFRDRGWVVTEVATPLEAIRKIIDERFEPSAIAIADTFPEPVAEDLRDFLAGEYPGAHMIEIGESADDRDPADSWVSSRDSNPDIGNRVGRVITSHDERSRPLTMPTRKESTRDGEPGS